MEDFGNVLCVFGKERKYSKEKWFGGSSIPDPLEELGALGIELVGW